MNSFSKIFKHTDLMLGIGLLAIVSMLILPLPHWALDFGLVIAIASSIIIVLASVNVDDPMKLSVFPSLLLITTLFRLALSITATKLILGSGDGGEVIKTFGNFVMGGDFVVGFVAFLILMIVQFMVITNGAGRVSEVVARFTLDAMPGKQMAIDADLAAGAITEEQARERRKNIKKEADFYGAMDGASKFVKGDAIASIMIIGINIIGGFAVGFFRGEGDAMTILRTYALMSVGEGLVSQIPALLISTASGLLVTRSGQERAMGGELIDQMLGQPKAILGAGVGLFAFALIPGFPKLIFIALGAVTIGVYRFAMNPLSKKAMAPPPTAEQQAEEAAKAAAAAAPQGPEAVLGLVQVDPLEIEIGHGLLPLADRRQGGDLPDRISATRRDIAMDLGFVMPSVRIRDDIDLESNEYIIKVRGEEVARAKAEPGLVLALSNPSVLKPLAGIHVKEPVFGMDAVWIDPGQVDDAKMSGYAVIEANVMITTHLAEIVKRHAADLLSRQDVNTLVENAKQVNPTVVSELVPAVLKIGDVQKVLRHLVRERVPIRDMVTILETMADYAERVKDTDMLGELVRSELCRTITRQYSEGGKLSCLTFEPVYEDRLVNSVQNTTLGSALVLDPDTRNNLISGLRSELEKAMSQNKQPVLLSGNVLRLPLRRLIEHDLPTLHVMAYNEVASNADVEIIGAVRMPGGQAQIGLAA